MAEMTNTTTRRALIAGAATIPTAFVLGSPLASAKGRTLPGLIEAHRTAYARKMEAYDVEEAIEDALLAEPNPMIPFNVLNDGSCTGYYELGQVSADEIRGYMRDAHKAYRDKHCSDWARKMAPGFVSEMEASIAASEARALQALADAEAAIEERKRTSGLPEAEARASEASDAEHDARMAVAAYRPENVEELQTKTAYMRSVDAFDEIVDETSVAHYLVAAIDRQAAQL